jgi:hypothetical protein
MGTAWWAIGVIGVVGLALLSACGSGSSGPTAAEESGPSASTTLPTLPNEQPAGSPLADGLVVPPGASLAGAVFRDAPYDGTVADRWTAHLVIEGDPFVAWDDLARQLWDLEAAVPMPGSRDSCQWVYKSPAEVATGQLGAPTGGYPEAQQTAADLEITAAPPNGEVWGIECYATAVIGADVGAEQGYAMGLRMGEDWPATLLLERLGPDLLGGATSTAGRVDPASGEPGAAGRDAVPTEAVQHLPGAPPQPDPAPGEPFGTVVNCFARGSRNGDGMIVLPEGSSVVGDGWSNGGVSVIAVSDPAGALADLRGQFEGEGTDRDSGGELEEIELPGGGTATRYSHEVSGGGGACEVLSSPDGRFLRIARYAD